jgi:cell division septal protein FtsQ
MEEEKKDQQTQETREEQSISIPKSVLKTAVGLIFIFFGLLAVFAWWQSLLTVIKGCLGIFLILIGAVVVAIAKE